MGYYAGYALSLFGREQDRLSHVLVSAPFESSFEFYYPTPVTRVIGVSGGALADASKAQVHLAQIPFVRLRSMLPADMRQGRTGFAAAVQAAGQRLAPPRMVIDVQAHRIEADGLDLTLRPWEFALLALLAYRASTGKLPLQAPGRDFHDKEWAAEVRTQLHQALGKSDVPDSVTQQLNSDASGSALAPHWSRLRNRLRDCLGSGRTAIYFDEGYTVFEDGGSDDDENNGRPKSKRRYRRKHYCVPLEAEAIEWRR